jgi:hypothetical protein
VHRARNHDHDHDDDDDHDHDDDHDDDHDHDTHDTHDTHYFHDRSKWIGIQHGQQFHLLWRRRLAPPRNRRSAWGSDYDYACLIGKGFRGEAGTETCSPPPDCWRCLAWGCL